MNHENVFYAKAASNGCGVPKTSGGGSPRVVARVLDYTTREKFELRNVTDRVNEVVAQSGIAEGIVNIQTLHTTTALFLNEWQDALLHDMKTVLGQLVGGAGKWRHDDPDWSDCERQNAASHLQALLLGPSLSLQVRGGCVLLGTWQSIILAELDGPRTRTVSVQVLGICPLGI